MMQSRIKTAMVKKQIEHQKMQTVRQRVSMTTNFARARAAAANAKGKAKSVAKPAGGRITLVPSKKIPTSKKAPPMRGTVGKIPQPIKTAYAKQNIVHHASLAAKRAMARAKQQASKAALMLLDL